ncbi:uncharacterized protein LOC127852755 [Dreissena polymorpha]|nr:uncharacterized protein LOC127852755 [Dreissena polymorpha]XP_052242676.1 uncharacterized protein LOC127852755 [Dreissena polymorpha]
MHEKVSHQLVVHWKVKSIAFMIQASVCGAYAHPEQNFHYVCIPLCREGYGRTQLSDICRPLEALSRLQSESWTSIFKMETRAAANIRSKTSTMPTNTFSLNYTYSHGNSNGNKTTLSVYTYPVTETTLSKDEKEPNGNNPPWLYISIGVFCFLVLAGNRMHSFTQTI